MKLKKQTTTQIVTGAPDNDATSQAAQDVQTTAIVAATIPIQ